MSNPIHITDEENIEIITVDLGNFTISSIYKPPNTPFNFTELSIKLPKSKNKNSHW